MRKVFFLYAASALASCAWLVVGCSSEPESEGRRGEGGRDAAVAGRGGGAIGGAPVSGGAGGTSTSTGGSSAPGGSANGGSTGGTGSSTFGGDSGTAGTSATGGSAGTGGFNSGGGNAGAGGVGTGGSGGAATAFCPPGSDALILNLNGVIPERVAGVPPSPPPGDNLEGPVWIGGSLYLSEITFTNGIDPARLLKYTPGSGTTVLLDTVTGGQPGETAGTNGLAVDGNGNLLAARQYDGSISRIDLSMPTDITPLVSTYLGHRFNSPNDLAVHSNGGIYFTDPDYQGPSPAPQAEERAYWVPRGGSAQPIAGAPTKPNGITLSGDEATLFIVGSSGLMRYPVASDGSVGTGTSMTNLAGDGMGKDCAGNLYVAQGGSVHVFNAAFREITPSIAVPLTGGSVTNVAFGGPKRTTLYITSLQPPSLFSVELNVPGYPY